MPVSCEWSLGIQLSCQMIDTSSERYLGSITILRTISYGSKISSKTFGDHKIEIFLIIDPLRKVISNLSDFFLLEKFHGFKKERLPPKKKTGDSWMYPGPNVSLWEIRIQALYSGHLWVITVIISKKPLIKLAWGSIQIAESLIVRMVKRNEITHHPDCCAIFGWQ